MNTFKSNGGFTGLAASFNRVEKFVAKLGLTVRSSVSEKSDSRYLIITQDDCGLDADGYMIEGPLVKVRFSGHALPSKYADNNEGYTVIEVRSTEDVKAATDQVKAIFAPYADLR